MCTHVGLSRAGSLLVIFVFLGNVLVFSPVFAGKLTVAGRQLILPKPGTMARVSSAYIPLMLKGIKVHPENPFRFDFILDQGTDQWEAQSSQLKAEAQKLIKYFLASLTVPENDLWVVFASEQYQDLVLKFKSFFSHSEDIDDEAGLMVKIAARLGHALKTVNGIGLVDIPHFAPFIYLGRGAAHVIQQKAVPLNAADPNVPEMLDAMVRQLSAEGIRWVPQAKNAGVIEGKPVILDFGDLTLESPVGGIHEQAMIGQDAHLKKNTGGIDFKGDKVDVQIRSRQMGTGNKTVPLFVDPAMLARFQNASGFEPVIVGIRALPAGEAGNEDLRLFLGVTN